MKKSNWVGMLPFYLLAAIVCIGIALMSSDAVTTAVQQTPVPRKWVLIIDAGHGGMDPGATSCTGEPESMINLQIALRLQDLMHLLGMETTMIRTTDTSVHTEGNTVAAQKASDLRERARICNETENAVLISIHQNTFPDGRYHGAQIFYGKQPASEQLARTLQTLFCETLNPGSNRRCKPGDGIYLLEQLRCPGVLVECGFLSNPEEEARLRSGEYQKKICCVIASGVSDFLQNDG